MCCGVPLMKATKQKVETSPIAILPSIKDRYSFLLSTLKMSAREKIKDFTLITDISSTIQEMLHSYY